MPEHSDCEDGKEEYRRERGHQGGSGGGAVSPPESAIPLDEPGNEEGASGRQRDEQGQREPVRLEHSEIDAIAVDEERTPSYSSRDGPRSHQAALRKERPTSHHDESRKSPHCCRDDDKGKAITKAKTAHDEAVVAFEAANGVIGCDAQEEHRQAPADTANHPASESSCGRAERNPVGEHLGIAQAETFC